MESWISRRAVETANLERPRRGFLVAGTISTSGSLGSRRPSYISARCLIGRSRPAGEATDQGISGPALEGSNSKKCSGEEGLKWSEAAGGSEIAYLPETTTTGIARLLTVCPCACARRRRRLVYRG